MRIVEEDEEGMPIGDGSQAPSTHVLLIHNSTLNKDIILVILNKINTITILKYKYIKIIYKYKNNLLIFRITWN